jgi:type II secretion system protein C
VLIGFCVIAGSYVVSSSASAWVAHLLRVPPDLEARSLAATEWAREPTPEELIAIAERNLFGASREILVDEPRPPWPGQGRIRAEGCDYGIHDLHACTMAAALRGTVVDDMAPHWSMAIIHHGDETRVVYVANQIEPGTLLCEIRSRAVVVRRADHYELCSADERSVEHSAKRRAPVSVTTLRPVEPNGVTRLSDDSWEITREQREWLQTNFSTVARQARFVPLDNSGGMQIRSIRRGSIFEHIGLKNGDIITSVNGYTLDSPDKILAIYQKLNDAPSLSVEVNRRGLRRQHRYRFVE